MGRVVCPLLLLLLASSLPGQDALSMEQIERCVRIVENLRQLKFSRIPNVVTKKQKELNQWLTKRKMCLDDSSAYCFERLGLASFQDAIAGRFQATDATAYFSPSVGVIVIAEDEGVEAPKDDVLIHEFVHALDNVHFGIDETALFCGIRDRSGYRNDDQLFAYVSLLEGDATLVSQLAAMKIDVGSNGLCFAAKKLLTPSAALTKESIVAAMEDQLDALSVIEGEGVARIRDDFELYLSRLEGTPRLIVEFTFASHYLGMRFIIAGLCSGGWKAVDNAFLEPPISSEQVIHPEKFFGNLDRQSMLDVSEVQPAGFQVIDRTHLGEYLLNMVLRHYGCTEGDAAIATCGWDGDSFVVFSNHTGETVSVLATTWDSQNDSAEFSEAYASILPRRFDEYAAFGTGLFFCGKDLGYGALLTRGREVFVIEGGDLAFVESMSTDLIHMDVEHIE